MPAFWFAFHVHQYCHQNYWYGEERGFSFFQNRLLASACKWVDSILMRLGREKKDEFVLYEIFCNADHRGGGMQPSSTANCSVKNVVFYIWVTSKAF